MNWKLWTRGLFAALLGGMSTGIALWAVDGADFNLDTGLVKLGKVVFVSALVSGASYLKEHPDPWGEFVNRSGK